MPASDFLENGPENAPATLILAHGAGAPMDTPFMNRVAEGIAEAGYRVLRFEFPYMAARRTEGGRRPPDRQPVLLETWRETIAAASGTGPLFIGGKSMGGRMATLVAEESGVAGTLCFGYPFHPPGNPEKLRTAHLETMTCPTLILQGERDPFGGREEVEGYKLSGNVELYWAADGNHDLAPRKASGHTVNDNLAGAIDAALKFMKKVSRSGPS
ncbi:alpha/beta family hydrolase [Nisaea sediminum]|uniref:alpha/beta family hydrolase n=1 Tax=Nisaea sediminum TaxID=2775867 RepID=UPI0018680A6B|nr:alpha/beta family hydrolase [Nisaea sediminum]